jgi:transposase-like protein
VSTHAAVFYCPYCGEEDLRPAEGGHGQWLCVSCRRVWSVKFVGLAVPPDPARAERTGVAP